MDALIIVDLQNDFCPGGALAVNEGNLIVPMVNELQKQFDVVVATQDWHPKDHGSFASNHGREPGELILLNGLDQVLWPAHCVQGTNGAAFVDDLNMELVHKVFQKGADKTIDSYSGFFDNGQKKSTGLYDYLKEKSISSVYITGLATDYCVKFTALDAQKLGFKTTVLTKACRGVDLKPGDVDSAIKEMIDAGISVV